MASAFRLEHTAIPAEGALFDETVTFYKEMFDMEVVREVRGENQHFAFLSDGKGGMIELLDVPGEPLTAPSHLAFMVSMDEFEPTRADLAERGITFDPVFQTDAGDLLAYFRDPAGNCAQLIDRKDPFES